jgi:cytoplasmic iron level regulating protein YaaA (DUF328/UPF0246 family)
MAMDIYLLPSDRKQSSMDLVKRKLSDVWYEEKNNRYLFLNPEREEIIKSFGVGDYPLLPAWRRYKGTFWDNLHMWALPSAVQRRIEERGIILSPLFGILAPSDLIPPYRLDYKDRFKGRTLRSFWKEKLQNLFNKLLAGKVVLDLLKSPQREVVSFPESSTVVRFEYIRAGKRVVNPLPHRAYTLRYIAERDIDINGLSKINFLDYEVKDMKRENNILTITMEGRGKYI